MIGSLLRAKHLPVTYSLHSEQLGVSAAHCKHRAAAGDPNKTTKDTQVFRANPKGVTSPRLRTVGIYCTKFKEDTGAFFLFLLLGS